MASAVGLAYRSGSRQIKAASRFILVSWLFSLQFWLVFDGENLTLAYLVIDVALAFAFYRLSRGSWFPAPLFLIQLLTLLFHLYALLVSQDRFWMVAFLNRTFELSLVYIAACALYRIRRLT